MGIGGKDSGGGTDYNAMAYNNAYAAAQGGQSFDNIAKNTDPNYLDAAKAGFSAYAPSIHSAHSAHFAHSAHSASSSLTDWAAMQAEAQEAADRRVAEASVNQLYAMKFAAANDAADKVNSQIAEEYGYAKTNGADYSISDAEKAERVNNAFASLWSSENEAQLSGLEKTWGNAGNKWTSSVVRGVTSEDDPDREAGDSAGGAVNPGAVFAAEEEDEDNLLGGVTGVLGGLS